MNAKPAKHLKRYLHQAGHFKASVVDVTRVGQQAFRRLQASPQAIQLLTQAMAASLLMVSERKDEGTLSLKFTGDGPCQHITAEANTLGHVRGYVGNLDLDVEFSEDKGLFQTAMGSGELTIRRRSGRSHKLYTSVVPMISGEMALNLSHYLLHSEQIPSATALGAHGDPELGIKGAAGILIQALPEADESILAELEQRLSALPPLGDLFAEDQGRHHALEAILFKGLGVQVAATHDVSYACHCSKSRIESLLKSMKTDMFHEISSTREPVEMRCQFCQKAYVFSPEEIVAIEKGRPQD